MQHEIYIAVYQQYIINFKTYWCSRILLYIQKIPTNLSFTCEGGGSGMPLQQVPWLSVPSLPSSASETLELWSSLHSSEDSWCLQVSGLRVSIAMCAGSEASKEMASIFASLADFDFPSEIQHETSLKSTYLKNLMILFKVIPLKDNSLC